MKEMNSLRAIGLFAVLAQLCIVGCNKNESASSNGGSPTTPAAPVAVAATEANATGVWQSVKLEDDKGKPLSGGIFADLLSQKIEVRPDHTYGLTNTAIGHASGSWR